MRRNVEHYIDMEVEDGGETIVLKMSVHDAEDIAWAVRRQYGGTWGMPHLEKFADDLQDLAESLDSDPRPGIQIVVVPRF